jgi:hypothetical protein
VNGKGKIGSTRCELDIWVKTLPQPRMTAMEATIFTDWDLRSPASHSDKVKVAHPPMRLSAKSIRVHNLRSNLKSISLRCYVINGLGARCC